MPDCGEIFCGNGRCDPGETAEDCQDCVVDADGDGFSPPADCDDADDEIFPGAPEACDLKDNDCDGVPDDCPAGMNCVNGQCAVDQDGDGFSPPQDCDDTDQNIHPGAQEVCDNIDNDCNGLRDDMVALPSPCQVCFNGQVIASPSGFPCPGGTCDGQGNCVTP